MSERKKRVRITSPKGVAKFPWLNEPDYEFSKEGRYQTGLLLDPEEHADFLAQLDQWADEAFEEAKEELLSKAKTKAAQKRALEEIERIERHAPYRTDYNEDDEETGLVEVRFSSKAQFVRDDGTVVNLRPRLFDAQGKPINPEEVRIFGGSIIRVNFTPSKYFISAMKSAGVRLQLNAVQVIELVEGGADASFFGFEAEEGFSVENTDSDSSFDDEEITEDDF